MDINGVSSCKVLNFYRNNTSKNVKDSNTGASANDSLEISNLGKKLSAYTTDDAFSLAGNKVDLVRDSISNGTYNIDAKLVAQKMVNSMKGKGV